MLFAGIEVFERRADDARPNSGAGKRVDPGVSRIADSLGRSAAAQTAPGAESSATEASEVRIFSGISFTRFPQAMLERFWSEQDGADLMEYALLLGFIGMAVIAAMDLLGDSLGHLFHNGAEKVAAS